MLFHSQPQHYKTVCCVEFQILRWNVIDQFVLKTIKGAYFHFMNSHSTVLFSMKKNRRQEKAFYKMHLIMFMKLLVLLTNIIILHCRNIIHGSDGPETAKDEINLWFKEEELVTYTSSAEKWVYGVNWWTFFLLSFLPAEEGVETYLW